MGSSGGVFDIAEALRMPAMAVESGPAAGVIAAALAGRQLGRPNLISFDMGGTTAKASVIVGGEVAVTAEYEVGGAGQRQTLDARHRPSDPRAGDRPCRGQRRRRLDRLGRSRRRVESRAAQRRRRSRPGRVRRRRHATDGDRRRRGAGLSGSRRAAGRRAAHRPRGGGTRDRRCGGVDRLGSRWRRRPRASSKW